MPARKSDGRGPVNRFATTQSREAGQRQGDVDAAQNASFYRAARQADHDLDVHALREALRSPYCIGAPRAFLADVLVWLEQSPVRVMSPKQRTAVERSIRILDVKAMRQDPIPDGAPRSVASDDRQHAPSPIRPKVQLAHHAAFRQPDEPPPKPPGRR